MPQVTYTYDEKQALVEKYWLNWYACRTTMVQDAELMEALGCDGFTALHFCLRANSRFYTVITDQLRAEAREKETANGLETDVR